MILKFLMATLGTVAFGGVTYVAFQAVEPGASTSRTHIAAAAPGARDGHGHVHGLSAPSRAAWNGVPHVVLEGTWAKSYPTLKEAARGISALVEAEVVGERPGPELPAVDDDDRAIPTTLVRFKTLHKAFGNTPDAFELFVTGGTTDKAVYTLGDTPDYQPGDRYVLMLEPRIDPDGNTVPATYVTAASNAALPVEQGRTHAIEAGDRRPIDGVDPAALMAQMKNLREEG